MSATLELVDQIFQANPVTLSPSLAQWHTHDEKWCLRLEAHAPSVYRLRWGPLSWLEPKKQTLRMQRQANLLLARHDAVGEMQTTQIADSSWAFEQGQFSVQLNKDAYSIRILHEQNCIAKANIVNLPETSGSDEPNDNWQINWDLDKDESIYGLGETQAKLSRNGQVLISDKPADRALPLAWSTHGWGVYVNTLNRVEHDLKAKSTYKIKANCQGLDLFIFVGDPSEILNQYTSLTGRAGQPELWSMGVWLDQAKGQTIADSFAQVKSLRKQKIALDTLSLSAPSVFSFMADKPVFEWSERLPDVRDLAKDLESLNLHLAGTCFPGVLADTELFAEWEDRGWLLTDPEGNAWVYPGNEASGNKPFGLLDLSYKDAAKLWSENHQKAIDDGLSSPICQAQFDFPDDVDTRGGESGDILRNLYPHLARQTLFDAVAAWRTPQEGVIPSRDLFPGVQRFAWQQGPDVDNTWDGFAKTLKAALATGNSGVAVQTHKLGNSDLSTKDITPELYLRWLAMAVFSANFSFQGLPDLMPDAFDVKTRKLIKHWLEWRYRLLPYIAGIIDDAVRTGLPVQRSMAQVFPHDKQAHAWEYQYMLGPALLIAPVMQAGNTTEVYLPAGDAWWDLNTGWRYEGGTTWSMDVDLDTIPVFGREGHILCVGSATENTEEINSARILEEVWLFGMPVHNPVVMRNKIRVMQMQGSSYIKGLEGLKILPSEGLEVKRRGAEVRISRAR